MSASGTGNGDRTPPGGVPGVARGPRLEVVVASRVLQVLPLAQSDELVEVWIGRNSTCQIRIPPEFLHVSRNHAVIRQDGRFFTLHNMSTGVGIFVNGKHLSSSAVLSHGDRITLSPRDVAGWGGSINFLDEEGASGAFNAGHDQRSRQPDGLGPTVPGRPPLDVDVEATEPRRSPTQPTQRPPNAAAPRIPGVPDQLRSLLSILAIIVGIILFLLILASFFVTTQ